MNAELTELVFILDRSGSINGLESDVMGGFNLEIWKCVLQLRVTDRSAIVRVLWLEVKLVEMKWMFQTGRRLPPPP